MKLLRDLYYIFSPSGFEQQMSKYIQNYLTNLGIDYWTVGNQIYRIRPNEPMLCAHMDQVSNRPLQELILYNSMIEGDANLGADDKNGIWICLKLLEEFPNTSFIFSTGEENGCDIDIILELEKDNLDDVLYCLVFDRRNGTDIVGTLNNYCFEDLENTVYNLGIDLGFKPNAGIFSDCDMLSIYGVPCVNISCGYYNSHTNNEFTDLDELLRAKILGGRMLNRVKAKFKRAENDESYFVYGMHYGAIKDNNIVSVTKSDTLYCYECHSYFKEKDLINGAFCPECGSEDGITDIYDNEVSRPHCPICMHELDDDEDYCEYCGEDLWDENIGPHQVIDTNKEDYYCSNCERIVEDEEVINRRCPDCGALLMFCESEDLGDGKIPVQFYF